MTEIINSSYEPYEYFFSFEPKVVLEATCGNGNLGDIAVDDFRVFDGECYPRPTPADSSGAVTPSPPL